MSKKCPLCGKRSFIPFQMGSSGYFDIYKCKICGSEFLYTQLCEITVFDQITASPETLAGKLVYHGVTTWDDEFYASTICDEIYKTRAEAIAATLAKLKEVAE